MGLARRLVLCSLLAAVVWLPATGAEAAAPWRTMVLEVNNLRQANGLPALRASKSLHVSSRHRARSMMRSGVFGHAAKRRARERFGSVAEALAIHPGHRLRIKRTVQSWWESPAHRPLLLSSDYTHLGAGVARGRFAGSRTTIWVLKLGKR